MRKEHHHGGSRTIAMAAATVPAVLALLAAGAAGQGKEAGAEEEAGGLEPVQVLYVCGGCCHDYDAQKVLIESGLEEMANIEVEVVHQGGTSTDAKIELYEDEDWAEGYDVVIHHECLANVDDLDWVRRILRPHREGLPAVVVHCAMHSYRKNPEAKVEWQEMLGVVSPNHGKKYPFTVYKNRGEHPILETFPLGWLTPAGELYRIDEVLETATVLARVKDQETGVDQPVVWTNDYRGTRVFGTTIGHHTETVATQEFLELLTRGTLWAAGRLRQEDLKVGGTRVEKVNLASGKEGSASSEEGGKGNVARHAFDGDLGTRWCADGASFPQWLEVDLGEAQDMAGLRVVWESENNAYAHRVLVSDGGEEWEELADGREAGPGGTTLYAIARQGVRKVRLEVLGSSAGGWASVRELAVLGEEELEIEVAAASAAVAGDEAAILGSVKVPEGWGKTVFAGPPSVNYPTFVKATADGGALFVSSDGNGSLDKGPLRGSVLRVVDRDGDGRGDGVTRFVPDIDSPRGLEWDGEWLYVLHPPQLSRFRDLDGDGISDEGEVLVDGIGFGLDQRTADHTSNGVVLGIDGWLYLAIGDFGFQRAVGADGTELALRAGGVVRVRPDGSGMHLYARGTRNIYGVGLSPSLDGFARDNTNDGGGWDTRLHHFSGGTEHGYPSLYKHFPEDHVAALADYGGGSGTGALWLAEPGFPEAWDNVLLTVDWGRNQVYRHELARRGASFEAVAQHEFLGLPRPTDITADASGRLYVASWRGGQFRYAGENIGYVAAVTPPGWERRAIAPARGAAEENLVGLLGAESHLERLHAQREILRAGHRPSVESLVAMIEGEGQVEARLAVLWTLAQVHGEGALESLVRLGGSGDELIAAHAVRALGDLPGAAGYPAARAAMASAAAAGSAVIRKEAAFAMARWGDEGNAGPLLGLAGDEDPVVAHTALRALRAVGGVDECLAALADGLRASEHEVAARALGQMHDEKVVDGLAEVLRGEIASQTKEVVLAALARLYHREGDWDGSFWGTRPDTSGPYYKRERWELSDRIGELLAAAIEGEGVDVAKLAAELGRNHINVGDPVPRLLALVEGGDKGSRGVLLEAITRAGTKVEGEVLDALVRMVREAKEEGDMGLLTRAAQPLSQAEDGSASELVYAILAEGVEGQEGQRLLGSYLGNRWHENRYLWFLERAEAGEVLAWKVLLQMGERKEMAPEVRGEIDEAIGRLVTDAGRHVAFLRAVGELKHQGSAKHVLAAMGHPSAEVAEAAKVAAGAMKLDTSASEGPKIAELEAGDVLDAIEELEGDVGLGEVLFTRQTCVACHTVREDQPLKGPYMGNIAGIYGRRQLAESILDPGQSIAQGFATHLVKTRDGRALTGFVSREAAEEVELRDIAGQVTRVKVADIEERQELEISMMPPGLVSGLTVKEFASLLSYLEGLNEAP